MICITSDGEVKDIKRLFGGETVIAVILGREDGDPDRREEMLDELQYLAFIQMCREPLLTQLPSIEAALQKHRILSECGLLERLDGK